MRHNIHQRSKGFLRSILMLSMLVSLAACGGLLKNDPLGFLTAEDKSAAPPPPSLQEPDPLDTITGTLPKDGMLATMGLNLDTYFAKPAADPNARLERLERVVTAMHKDLKSLSPPIVRFKEMQKDLEDHIAAYPLAPANRQIPAAIPMMKDKPVPETMIKKPMVKAAEPPQSITTKTVKSVPHAGSAPEPKTISAGATRVKRLRTGIHKDKVRIVLDVTGKTGFSTDLDNNEKILVIDIPGASWSTAKEKNFNSKTPLLQSYRADPNGNGTLLALQLRQPSSILFQKAIPANLGNGQRIVIDLAR